MSASFRPGRPTILAAIVAVVLLAALSPLQAALASAGFTGGTYGYDISYPQGSGPYPASSPSGVGYSFGVVGVTDGKPYTRNPNLAGEAAWVASHQQTLSLYLNLAAAAGPSASGVPNSPRVCAKSDKACLNFDYGWNAAQDAYNYAATQNASAGTWWLDVETANLWTGNTTNNFASIQGAMAFFQGIGLTVGVYSTPSNWSRITGNASLGGTPIWIPGAPSLAQANTRCGSADAFGGGTVTLVQYGNGSYDEDYAC